MKQRLADYVADFLMKHGVTDVFSVVGGGAMHLNDALGHHEKLHVTYNHHEQACAIAAEAYARLDDLGLSHIHLCPETMGRVSQIGDLQETLSFCQLDERLIPCIDFAHLHALGHGALNAPEDFAAVLDAIESALGPERAHAMHIHFSTIEYTAAGEKRHRTFAEEAYGPRFQHLAPLLKERGYQPRVICECKGTMAEDAKAMMEMYESLPRL